MPPKPGMSPMTAKLLRQKRKALRLTQGDVAEYMGMNRVWLGKIEQGNAPLTKTTWLAYRMALQDLTPVRPTTEGERS